MLLLRIALPVFLAYLFTALSLGMFVVFIATEYDSSKFLELMLFSCMGVLDIMGLVYLFVMRKRILGVYKISEDGMSLDMEKGEKQRLVTSGKKEKFGVCVEVKEEEFPSWNRDRVMDLY